jgi:hypothetical protein
VALNSPTKYPFMICNGTIIITFTTDSIISSEREG